MDKKNSIALTENSLNLALGINSGSVKLSQIEMGLDIKDTFDKPLLRSVFKGQESVSFTAIKTLVTRFIDSFGFSTKLNDSQIEILSVDTFENFAYESLTDIILFFKMARSGQFGTTNRGVDSNLIFGDWFPKYLEKKAELRENEYTKKKGEQLSGDTSIEDVKKAYAKKNIRLTQQQFIENVKSHIEHITKAMDRQMLEDTILDWSKDKDKKPFLRLLKEKRKTIN